jgi:hypothetical protein
MTETEAICESLTSSGMETQDIGTTAFSISALGLGTDIAAAALSHEGSMYLSGTSSPAIVKIMSTSIPTKVLLKGCCVDIMGPGAEADGGKVAVSPTYVLQEKDTAMILSDDRCGDIMRPGATANGLNATISPIYVLQEKDTATALLNGDSVDVAERGTTVDGGNMAISPIHVLREP